MTREFILNTLLPYKEDPSTCAYDKETKKCYYLTEDGKELVNGDDFWLVDNYAGNYQLKYWRSVNMQSFEQNKTYLDKKSKFSTKEKAEDYIILNKPVLSINDLKNIRSDFPKSSEGVSVTYGALRQLVKSRL